MTEAARAHHLIERAPDGPISGVNGRPRACALMLPGALLAPVLDAFFFVISVNCYDFLWPPCVLSRKRVPTVASLTYYCSFETLLNFIMMMSSFFYYHE